jgi:hypothetical protein
MYVPERFFFENNDIPSRDDGNFSWKINGIWGASRYIRIYSYWRILRDVVLSKNIDARDCGRQTRSSRLAFIIKFFPHVETGRAFFKTIRLRGKGTEQFYILGSTPHV